MVRRLTADQALQSLEDIKSDCFDVALSDIEDSLGKMHLYLIEK